MRVLLLLRWPAVVLTEQLRGLLEHRVSDLGTLEYLKCFHDEERPEAGREGLSM